MATSGSDGDRSGRAAGPPTGPAAGGRRRLIEEVDVVPQQQPREQEPQQAAVEAAAAADGQPGRGANRRGAAAATPASNARNATIAQQARKLVEMITPVIRAFAVSAPPEAALTAREVTDAVSGAVQAARELLQFVDAPSDEKDPTMPSLALQDISTIAIIVELSLVVGCTWLWEPGTTLDLSKRPLSQKLQLDSSRLATTVKHADMTTEQRLDLCGSVVAVLVVLLPHEELAVRLLPSFSADVFLTLMHLAYSPAWADRRRPAAAGPRTFSAYDTPATIVAAMTAGEVAPHAAVSSAADTVTSCASTWPLNHVVNSFQSCLRTLKKDTPKPAWLVRECGIWLSRCLMLPLGVQTMGLQWLESVHESNLQAVNAVATQIARTPHDLITPEEYYSCVGPQLVHLLRLQGQQGRKLAFMAALSIAAAASSASPAAFAYVVRPLLWPLLRCLDIAAVDAEKVLADESQVIGAIEDIHRVLTARTPLVSMLNSFAPVMPVVFDVMVFARQAKAMVASACEEILCIYLKQHPRGAAQVLEWAIPDESDPRQQIQCAAGEEGGIVIVRRRGSVDAGAAGGGGAVPIRLVGLNDAVDPTSAMEARGADIADAVSALMSALKTTNVPGDLVVALLEEHMHQRVALPQVLAQEQRTGQAVGLTATRTKRYASGEQQSLTPDGPSGNAQRQRAVRILQLLADICERVGAAVLRNCAQTLTCVKSVLTTVATRIGLTGPTAAPDVVLFEPEDFEDVVSMCLGLLAMVVGGVVKVEATDVRVMRGLIPILEVISKYPEPQIQEQCTMLRISILTLPSTAETEDDDTSPAPGKPDVDPDEQAVAAELSIAMTEIRDPLVAVQAGALMRIRRLVRRRLTPTASRIDMLFDLAVSQMATSESYIFLCAARVVAALTDVYPSAMLPKLLATISQKSLALRSRVKLFDALGSTVYRCGDTLPQYAKQIVSSLLIGARTTPTSTVVTEEDEADAILIRASCVSILGDVCRVLGSRCSPFATNIIDLCSHILRLERKVEASRVIRRAAVVTFVNVIEGCNRTTLLEMAPVLLELVDPLKEATTYDQDSMTRGHANIALNRIAELGSDFMTLPKERVLHLRV